MEPHHLRADGRAALPHDDISGREHPRHLPRGRILESQGGISGGLSERLSLRRHPLRHRTDSHRQNAPHARAYPDGYVVCGVLLTAIGVYEPIVKWGGAGATVPLLGFGYSLAKGAEKAVQEQGWLGVMTGGLSATAGGIAAAVVFAVLMALIFKPGDKR